MNNDERTLNYMKENGYITQKIANNELGHSRLSASIFNLRKIYNVEDIKLCRPNRWGKMTHPKAYFLAEDKDRALRKLGVK